MAETVPLGGAVVRQLVEHLSWLEDHARGQADRPADAGRLRLATALVRNVINPYLEGTPPTPLHVAVVGGAGTGKSTITNFLVGAVVAEANPQAGFTRHPIAYSSENGLLPWSHHLGFLGSLQRVFEHRPSSQDEDIYQVRRVPAAGEGMLGPCVVWDCPDMTTWAASGYVPRLLEVVGLADVVVFVASDERYNDETPTQFLRLILQAGKPVVACIMKMREELAGRILEHFRREVVAALPECTRVAACLAVPHLEPEQLADPVHKAGRYRQPLVDQMKWWTARPRETRRGTVRAATDYMVEYQKDFLSVAREDLQALTAWRDLVHRGQTEFENRYRREYLLGESFPRFNESLLRLMELLELPGVGRHVSNVLWAVRTPYRLAKGFLTKMAGRPPAPSMPELPVLEAARNGWLDLLRKEAARRGRSHYLWDHVEDGFRGGLKESFQEQFQTCLREFQVGLNQDVDATARAIYEELEKNPIALNALRSIKFTAEAASIGGTIIAGGISWVDLPLVLIVTPLVQELVEFLGKQYVETQKERARERQGALFVRTLAAPLGEWLVQWPATGGSSFERLQTALRQIPELIEQLAALVRVRQGESEKVETGSASAQRART